MDKKVFTITDLKQEQINDKFYLSGYANNKGVEDSDGDIPTSFNGEPVYELGRMDKNPVCFVDHKNSASNIAGNFVELKEDDKGLFFKLLLRSLDQIFNDNVKDAVSSYMNGFGRALSIGGNWLFGDPEHSSHLTKALIYEISLVGVGADGSALTNTNYAKSIKTAVPYQNHPLADEGTPWSGSGARASLKKWAGAEDGLTTSAIRAKYRKGFLWYDTEKEDTFGAYKMPIATLIGGTLKAVPRGIFAAAGAVQGARGGVAIPASDIPAIKAHLNKYYKKMDKESPFEKGVFRLDYLTLDERVLESLLKSGVRFSNKHAKKLVALIKNNYRDDNGSVYQWDADDWSTLVADINTLK